MTHMQHLPWEKALKNLFRQSSNLKRFAQNSEHAATEPQAHMSNSTMLHILDHQNTACIYASVLSTKATVATQTEQQAITPSSQKTKIVLERRVDTGDLAIIIHLYIKEKKTGQEVLLGSCSKNLHIKCKQNAHSKFKPIPK